jgi:hypothetical protein
LEAAADYQANDRIGESSFDLRNKSMRLDLAKELVAFRISHELDEAMSSLDDAEAPALGSERLAADIS